MTRSGDVIHPQLRPLGLGPRLCHRHSVSEGSIVSYVGLKMSMVWLPQNITSSIYNEASTYIFSGDLRRYSSN